MWLEITTLLIPGENDSDAEIGALRELGGGRARRDVPLHFTAFHPDWRMRGHPPTPPATLTRARAIAMARGLRYVYTGNMHDPAGGSTWCHGCGALLIRRDWYELGVGAGCGRLLPRVRHRGGRRVRGSSRQLGQQAAAGAVRLERMANISLSPRVLWLLRRHLRVIDVPAPVYVVPAPPVIVTRLRCMVVLLQQ